MKPGVLIILLLAVAGLLCGSLYVYNRNADETPQVPVDNSNQVAVEFSGGLDTEPRDNGHPVNLIAAALGVTPDQFRTAFFQFVPAAEGEDQNAWKQHKPEMMKILGPYGVTDELLDAVMDYYQATRASGEIWPNTMAVAWAQVADGKITGFTMVDGGKGYNTPPTVRVAGFDSLQAEAVLNFGDNLDRNGSVTEIRFVGNDSR